MSIGAADISRLSITRFSAQYLVSTDHPSPEKLKDRLDEAVTKALPETLVAFVVPLCAETDSSVWLIRHLEINVDINAAWERDQLARAWGGQVARTLHRVVNGEGDHENVVRFPSRAALLARFLIDVADGRAWGKWYYELFEGLRMLPTSGTLRTAVCDQLAIGRAALLLLAPDELTNVLRALTMQDAKWILEELARHDPASDEFQCFQAAWSAWQTRGWETLSASDEWRNTLHLYLQASRQRTDVGGVSLQTAALAMLRLVHCLDSGSVSDRQQLVNVVIRGEVGKLSPLVGPANAGRITPLLCCPPAWLREVGAALVARTANPRGDEPVTASLRTTSCGGVFFLLPVLDELPLEEATRCWPDGRDVTASALVRFLLLVKCCGQSRAQRVFSDPLVRELFSIPSLSTAHVADWQREISPANQDSFLETLADWHDERGMVQREQLILARVPARGAPLTILIDGARGIWLCAEPFHQGTRAHLIEWVTRHLLRGEEGASRLLSDSTFLDPLRAAFPDHQVMNLQDGTVRALGEEDPPLAEILSRLDMLADDFSYLSFPKWIPVQKQVDRTLTVAAQNVMRGFAWRLPGFAGSNLRYLYDNFLDCSGSVEEETTRQVVRLGRPPLHLVLAMTGMNRKTYRMRWLDDRPFVLFPEE